MATPNIPFPHVPWPDMQVPNPNRLAEYGHRSAARHDRDGAIPWYTHSQSPSYSPITLDIDIDVPSYGVVFMNPPEEARDVAERNGTQPVYTTLLNGNLVVKLPGTIRYEAIKLGFRAECKLYGSGKKPEITQLYEVNRDIPGGVITGEQRFDFSFPIPSTLAPRDWHPKGNVLNYIYAEIIGTPPAPAPKSASPPLLARLNPFSPPKAMVKLPVLPDYETSQKVEMLVGTHTADRTIRLVYNPDPMGNVNELNVQAIGWISGRLISGSFRMYFNVSLLQIHTITATCLPPTTKPHVAQRRFPLVSSGVTPEKHHDFPDVKHPGLWRGIGAGGKDDGVLLLDMQERVLQDDGVTRPSTLPSVETPIHVAHHLDIDIYFATHGVGATGEKLRHGGVGALRVMRIRRKVMLPSCCILPKTVALPDYEHPEEWHRSTDPKRPWGQCACSLSMEEIEKRMTAAVMAEEIAAEEAKEAANAKAMAMRG